MAVIVLLSVNAVAKHNPGVQKIRFKLFRNHLIIASGQLGSIGNRNLLIDTGASPTVVDEALAHELGLKPVGRPVNGLSVVGGVAQTYYAVLDTLKLGPVHRESLVVAVANLSLMQAQVGLRIDAIVGLDALAPNSFQIDYSSRKVIFGSLHPSSPAVPMSHGAGFVIIETQINGAPVNLAVDTGTSQLLLFRKDLPETITSLQATANVQVSNVAGDVLAAEVHLAKFKVGRQDLSGSTALLTTVPNCCPFQGIFGISSLKFKRVTFDFQHELFGFEVVDDAESPQFTGGTCPGIAATTCRQAPLPGFVPGR